MPQDDIALKKKTVQGRVLYGSESTQNKEQIFPGIIQGPVEKNKDNIPINTVLIGTSFGKSFFLEVNRYNYKVGKNLYLTLSSAAEAVSGNRRSGWTFWKTSSGKSAKEAYKDTQNE